MIEDRYASAVEAMLFACGDAVPLDDLADALGTDKRTARKIVAGLAELYELEQRGIRIVMLDDACQMCTNANYFEYIEALGKAPKQRSLSPAVLETLAIIAYRQPATKTDIENIRGVDANHAVNRLVEYGLVNEVGRADAPGRPVLFGTSEEFLRFFGLSSLKELPGLPEPEALVEGEAQTEVDIATQSKDETQPESYTQSTDGDAAEAESVTQAESVIQFEGDGEA